MIDYHFWYRNTNQKGLNETDGLNLRRIAMELYPGGGTPDREQVLRKYYGLILIDEYHFADRWERSLGNKLRILNPRVENSGSHCFLAFDFPTARDLTIDPFWNYAGRKDKSDGIYGQCTLEDV